MRNSILITLYMADNENYWLLFFLIRKINARINIAKSTNPHIVFITLPMSFFVVITMLFYSF